jgi:hypothetical protein
VTPWPLSVAFPLTLLGAIVLVVGFDAAAAGITRDNPSVYRRLWPVQFALYVFVGFMAMLTTLELRYVEIIGAATGFVEATLGWVITWRIGPGRVKDANLGSMTVVVVSMTAFAFGLSIAGALLFNVLAPMIVRVHG